MYQNVFPLPSRNFKRTWNSTLIAKFCVWASQINNSSLPNSKQIKPHP
jgi:hypothetical protein